MKFEKELNHVSRETLASYKEMFVHLQEKHGCNYEEAIEELIYLRADAAKYYEIKVQELVEYSSHCTPKSGGELIKVMQNIGEEKQKDSDLYQAAFYSAIDNRSMAKAQHMKNALHDQDIIYSEEIKKYEQKIQARTDAQIYGSDGGKVFSRKSEELVFIALDLWRIKYQSRTNIEAANLLLNIINEKVAELNQAISISRTTRNTPMLEISEPETIAAWIGGLNKLINNKAFPKKARKCIKDYYVNYYLKDQFFSI
jgi:hypothetical protein